MSSDQKKRVLFICVHNSARSQMAEEYLRKLGGDLFDAESAGIEPGELNPNVIRVLQEDSIDISGKKTKKVWDLYQAGEKYDYVITVCSREAEERCPVFPGETIRRSWSYPDPAKFEGSEEEVLSRTRDLRNVIKEQVRQFVEAYKQKEPR